MLIACLDSCQMMAMMMSSHKECGPSRITRDQGDVLKLVEQFERFGVFDQTGNKLICITTGDVASDDIEDSLLQASQIGSKIVAQFAQERLISRTTPSHATLRKQASKTFASLYKKSGTKEQKNKNVKGDRDFFRRIIVSLEGGREVDISKMMENELSSVPVFHFII